MVFSQGSYNVSDIRFEELVNAHGRDVLNVALRVLGNAEMAKDVYQEVFLAIWRRWDTCDRAVNWGPYLYRVTVRKALELARARRHVPAMANVDDCEPQSSEPGPDTTLRFNELQQKLTESLAKLPKRQAEVFVLSRIEGMEHSAIARTLGCSNNSVRVCLHRAVKHLAREMSDYLS